MEELGEGLLGGWGAEGDTEQGEVIQYMVIQFAKAVCMLTYWILSSYLKTHTTLEVCIPQIEHATHRRGGTHNSHTLVVNGYYRGSLTPTQTV